MRRLAYRLVGPAVDDVLQGAYTAGFRARESFEGRARFETWMYRIVYNTSLNYLRDQRRRTPHTHDTADLSELPSGTAGPEELAVNRRDLAAALAELSAEQRAAVMLVDAEEMTFEQAANALGVAVGTVASRVSRARQSLRRHLQGGPDQ